MMSLIQSHRRFVSMGAVPTVVLVAAVYSAWTPDAHGQERRLFVHPDERPFQFAQAPGEVLLAQAGQYIGAPAARKQFDVSGAGLTAVIIDTGLNTMHVDFRGRIVDQRNFTGDNGGDNANALDAACPAGTNVELCVAGHGTNVTGIVAAGGIHKGVAPGAGVLPIKIVSALGDAEMEWFEKALKWVIATRKQNPQLGISVVNISLGDRRNHSDQTAFGGDSIAGLIRQLAAERVAVVVAAGNDYPVAGHQGMSFPAIVPETISVGAVYDANVGRRTYGGGAIIAERTRAGRIAPFSQRLHRSVSLACKTDIFAPGAVITSSGIQNEESASDQQGTSQAAPMTAGVVLLMQEWHKRHVNGELPDVARLEKWLAQGSTRAVDNYGDADNVRNTGLAFPVLHAVRALEAMAKDLGLPHKL